MTDYPYEEIETTTKYNSSHLSRNGTRKQWGTMQDGCLKPHAILTEL